MTGNSGERPAATTAFVGTATTTVTVDDESLTIEGAPESVFADGVVVRALATLGHPSERAIVMRLTGRAHELAWERQLGPTVRRTSAATPRVRSSVFDGAVRVFDLSDAPSWPWLPVRDDVELMTRQTIGAARREASSSVRDPWESFDVVAIDAQPEGETDYESFEPGSLGWVDRFTGRFDVGVVIVKAPALLTATGWRLLGELADRGGPGGFVVPDHAWPDFERAFTESLTSQDLWAIATSVDGVVVVGGRGRELDLLRVPTSGRGGLVSMWLATNERASSSWKYLRSLPRRSLVTAGSAVGSVIGAADDSWDMRGRDAERHIATFFDARPASRYRVLGIRSLSGERRRRARFHERERRPFADPLADRRPRDVQLGLFRAADGTELEPLAVFEPGESLHLRVQVSDLAFSSSVFDRGEPIEDWLPPAQPSWLEVALTPIDFEVEGSLTRWLWVPGSGPSGAITFDVAPSERDLVALRVSVFKDKLLLKSFRLVGVTNADVSSERLADALLLDDASAVFSCNWALREEYSRTADVGCEVSSTPAVSVIVNFLDDRETTSVIGGGFFGVGRNVDLVAYADDLRSALATLQAGSLYRFNDATNQGDPGSIDPFLISLARSGWRAFTALFPKSDVWTAIPDATSAPNSRIEIAETYLRSEPLPWGALYDRRLKLGDDGVRVCHSWPGDQDDPLTCGAAADCLLHVQKPDSVVCPSGFWGFRTIVEQPLGGTVRKEAELERGVWVQARQTAPIDVEPVVSIPATPVVPVGVYPGLPPNHDHERSVVEAIKAHPSLVHAPIPKNTGLDFQQTLGTADVVYLYVYCHQGEVPSSTGGRAAAKLLFRDPTGAPSPDDLPEEVFTCGPWGPKPIVVLNACQSGVFGPGTISPFVRRLVGTCEAQVVVVTEIDVFEPLAKHVGNEFTRRVVTNGQPVGEAMLAIRRDLLAINNPCALLYTTYGDHRVRVSR